MYISEYIYKKIYFGKKSFFFNYFATSKLKITIILRPTLEMCEIGIRKIYQSSNLRFLIVLKPVIVRLLCKNC